MREILFRGKRIDNGKWVYGSLSMEYFAECGCIMISPTSDTCYKVIPDTVGQFTGLTDKNGEKIFEGDILSTENGTFENTGMGHVLFYKGMWTSFYGQDLLDRDCFDELHEVCGEREVIGNIHDNPELLEVNDNG